VIDCWKDLFGSTLYMSSPTKRCAVCLKPALSLRNIAADYYTDHKDEIEAKKKPWKWCISCGMKWSTVKVIIHKKHQSTNYQYHN
jgi:hypothetical protein